MQKINHKLYVVNCFVYIDNFVDRNISDCFISDPLGEEMFDFDKWFGEEAGEQRPSRLTSQVKQKKRCPDCFAIFLSEFELFNHRIKECRPNRGISIVKVSNLKETPTKKPITVKTPKDEDDDPDYQLACIKVFACEGCGAKFKNNWNFKRHRQICKWLHAKVQTSVAEAMISEEMILAPKHRCDKCGITFNRLYNLKRHTKSSGCKGRRFDSDGIPTVKHLACSKCKKSFVSKESLRNHKILYCISSIPSTSSRPAKLYTCKGCGTNFTKNYNLTRHQSNTCPALKVFSKDSVCYVCSQTFETFDLLKEHLENCHDDQ